MPNRFVNSRRKKMSSQKMFGGGGCSQFRLSVKAKIRCSGQVIQHDFINMS